MNVRGVLIIIAIVIAMSMAVPWAIAAEAGHDEETLGDVDPTKPVVFNVREEFSKLQGDNWRNAFILRTDVIKLGGLRNFLCALMSPSCRLIWGGAQTMVWVTSMARLS